MACVTFDRPQILHYNNQLLEIVLFVQMFDSNLFVDLDLNIKAHAKGIVSYK